MLVLSIKPLCVIGCYMYRTLKLGRPFEVRGVEVRMRYDDSFEAPFLVDKVDGVLV